MISSKYNPKTNVLTITCDKKDIINAFKNKDSCYKFLRLLKSKIPVLEVIE